MAEREPTLTFQKHLDQSTSGSLVFMIANTPCL